MNGEQSKTGEPDRELTGFLAYLAAERNASRHTLAGYRMDIEQFARLILKQDAASVQIDWDNISVHDARVFVVTLQNNKLSKTSIIRKMSALRSFYRYLLREEAVRNNPFAGLTSPKRQKPLPKYLSVREVSRLLDAPADYWTNAANRQAAKSGAHADLSLARDRAMLEVIYSGGLRISEAVGLNLGSVDLLGNVMLVRGKGKKERLCALGNPAERALKSYLKVRRSFSSDTRRDAPLVSFKPAETLRPFISRPDIPGSRPDQEGCWDPP